MTKELKYKLIVNHVTSRIQKNELKKGDRIPSLNDFRKIYNCSRETVFTGINELRAKGIIDSIPGVGYYIVSAKLNSSNKIFLLFNEFNEFKEDLYNSFMKAKQQNDTVDLYFHNYNRKVFESLINEANGNYTIYIIMSGKFKGVEPLLKSLKGKVVLLDHFHPELKGKFSSVAQNFEKDTYEALNYGIEFITKYKRVIMVQSEEKEPIERYEGLQRFAVENSMDHKYLTTLNSIKINAGDLFILANDRDLVDILKKADSERLTPGREFGIISCNDTPLKEVLARGITTLTTDFKSMGESLYSLINKKTTETIENPWKFILRKTT